MDHLRRLPIVGLAGLLSAVFFAAPAGAQGFLSPLVGFDFGGDASCPSISNCQDKRLNAGVALGVMGPGFGFEEEFAYVPHFFGNAPFNLFGGVSFANDSYAAPPMVGTT